MSIKLAIYLKRTEQTLEGWMDANGVTRADELLPRCAYVGLAAGLTDVAAATEIFKKRKQQTKDATLVAQVTEAEVKPRPVKKKKDGPASIDDFPGQPDQS